MVVVEVEAVSPLVLSADVVAFCAAGFSQRRCVCCLRCPWEEREVERLGRGQGSAWLVWSEEMVGIMVVG